MTNKEVIINYETDSFYPCLFEILEKPKKELIDKIINKINKSGITFKEPLTPVKLKRFKRIDGSETSNESREKSSITYYFYCDFLFLGENEKGIKSIYGFNCVANSSITEKEWKSFVNDVYDDCLVFTNLSIESKVNISSISENSIENVITARDGDIIYQPVDNNYTLDVISLNLSNSSSEDINEPNKWVINSHEEIHDIVEAEDGIYIHPNLYLPEVENVETSYFKIKANIEDISKIKEAVKKLNPNNKNYKPRQICNYELYDKDLYKFCTYEPYKYLVVDNQRDSHFELQIDSDFNEIINESKKLHINEHYRPTYSTYKVVYEEKGVFLIYNYNNEYRLVLDSNTLTSGVADKLHVRNYYNLNINKNIKMIIPFSFNINTWNEDDQCHEYKDTTFSIKCYGHDEYVEKDFRSPLEECIDPKVTYIVIFDDNSCGVLFINESKVKTINNQTKFVRSLAFANNNFQSGAKKR